MGWTLRLIARGAVWGCALLGAAVGLLEWRVAAGWVSAALLLSCAGATLLWRGRTEWGAAAFGALTWALGGNPPAVLLAFWSAGVLLQVVASAVGWARRRRLPTPSLSKPGRYVCARCGGSLAPASAAPAR